MTKRYIRLVLEGALYGFFGGTLLWITLYTLYETNLSHLRSFTIDGLDFSYLSFPVEFSRLCLVFVILASTIRLISGICFPKHLRLFSIWLLTGMISIAFINFLLLNGPVPLTPEAVGFGWLCCINNSSGYLLWPLTILLIAVYSFLFVYARNSYFSYREKP